MEQQLQTDERATDSVHIIARAIEESDSAAAVEVQELADELKRRAAKRRGLRLASRIVAGLAFINVGLGAIGFLLANVLTGLPVSLHFNPLLFGVEAQATTRGGYTDINVGSGWIFIAIGLFVIAGLTKLASNEQFQALRRLIRTGDVRLVPPLIDSLDVGSVTDRILARAELPALLSRLRPSDSALLSDSQRETLRWAALAENHELVSAILRAWEQIGSPKDIPTAEKLQRGEGVAGKDPEVRALARECLVFLQQRADSTRSRDSLLRPSDSAKSGEESLLRPTTNAPSEDDHSLLRSSSHS